MKFLIAVLFGVIASSCLTSKSVLAGGTSSEGGGGMGCRIVHNVRNTKDYIGYLVIVANYKTGARSISLFDHKDDALAGEEPVSSLSSCVRTNPSNKWDLGVDCKDGTLETPDRTLSYDFEARWMANSALVGTLQIREGRGGWATLILSCQDHIGLQQ